MRLFIALEPEPDFRESLARTQELLKAAGVEGRYLVPSNLHLTLAFIGEWPEDPTGILPAIDKPFSVTLSHLGIFPEAKVLWAGVKPSIALDDLARRVRHELDGAGIPYDPQPFSPHITLVRKPVFQDSRVLSAVPVAPATMTVREVCLYKSVHEADGMKYTVIGRSGSIQQPVCE